jgi:hypothetical protein
VNTKGDLGSCSRCKRRSARSSSPTIVDTRSTLFDPTDVQRGRPEVQLIPAHVHQLGDPEAVAVGHEDHGGVPVAVAVALGRVHELLDLGLRQIFPSANVAVGASLGRNCSFYGSWRDQLQVPFRHVFGPPHLMYWSYNAPS